MQIFEVDLIEYFVSMPKPQVLLMSVRTVEFAVGTCEVVWNDKDDQRVFWR